jgi:hypothetical protein
VRHILRLLVISTLLLSCGDDRERRCHLAVKSLVAAPADRAAGELEKVVAFGRYALPDVEQEFHAASPTGRRRLLDALDRLRLREAQPFLAFVARWETDQALRRQAMVLARRFAAARRPTPPPP